MGAYNSNNTEIILNTNGKYVISPKALILKNITATNKVYDGNISAKINAKLEGIISGDKVNNTIRSEFDNKNAGRE